MTRKWITLLLPTGAIFFVVISLMFTPNTQAQPSGGSTCSLTKPALTGSGNEPSSITSHYGMRQHPISGTYKMHTGTDISSPGQSDCNQPVQAQSGCTEKFYGTRGGYGNHLILDCGNGVEISYSHLNNWNKNTNTMYVGTTGSSTGCHLHYETKIDDKLVDPECAWGTGTNCPANVGSGGTSIPNLCDPAQREALKNHDSSTNGTENPSGGDGGDTGEATPETPGHEDDDNHSHDFDDDTGDYSVGDPTPPTPETPTPNPEPPEPPEPRDPYVPTASTPRCDNSTCITQDTIDNAKHKHVARDNVITYNEFIIPPEDGGDCMPPTKTGATVQRQEAEDGKGTIREYPDAFCINQGCTYVNEGEDDGACE